MNEYQYLFEHFANPLKHSHFKENILLQTNTLYKLDQTCVHRPSINTSNQSVLRTFIKVTFSSELFNGFGNAWNYKLPHIKPTKNRAESRNHGII